MNFTSMTLTQIKRQEMDSQVCVGFGSLVTVNTQIVPLLPVLRTGWRRTVHVVLLPSKQP